MQFSHPFALWFLALTLVPLLVVLFFGKRYRVFLSEKLQRGVSGKLAWARASVASLIIASLVFVAADPIRTQPIRNPLKDGIDILFVLDLSKSMLAEDIAPNRINAGKRVLGQFISKRSNDRIGLIGFAGKPFVFSPLTFDHPGLLTIVNDITVDSIKQEIPGFSGTAMGDAMLLATDTLGDHPERQKVIVLLTDGEANVGIDPKIANEFVKKTGVTVHTIGIGEPSGTELFTTDSFGHKQYFMDNNGVPIRASIDEKLLKQIASDNHGVYANAASLKEMEKALEDLNRLYGQTMSSTEETLVHSYAPNIAYLALVLLLLWLGLECFSITSPFHLGALTGVRLTPESTNFSLLTPMVWTKRTLFIAGIAVLAIGAYGYRYTPPLGTISILIDGSKSMLVQDVGKSRFDLARDIANKIIDQYPGSPIRISVFGGDVLPLVPSTYDPEILKRGLAQISLKDLAGGSDIVGALRSLLAANGDEPGSIFVISDGEVIGNRTGMKDTGLNVPANTSIWTVGVGSSEGGNIPMGIDLFGKPVFKLVE